MKSSKIRFQNTRIYARMSLPDKICMLPWVSVEASPVGTIRPCCLAMDEITHPDGSKYNLKKDTLSDAYHSKYMQDLRQEFLDGKKPETCRRCWNEEDAGRTSKRINSRIRLKDQYYSIDWQNTQPDQLWFLDLKLGNICNLKCRICGSWSSSKWAKEELAYTPELKDKTQHLAYQQLRSGTWPRDNNLFWDNLKTLLPQVKYIEFTGGEPFLIEQHFELLRYAVDQGYSKNIEIHYNTNGTVFPDEAELWKKFKHVEIALSIDNIGERFEYERYGAKWSDVQKNIDKIIAMQSLTISHHLCITLNIQNVYYLPEICKWIDTQLGWSTFFNMLHDPWYMNIARMTPAAKELVINRLTEHAFSPKYKIEILKIINFINNGSGSNGEIFVTNMMRTDAYRNESFLDTHKEIAGAMGYDPTEK